MPKIILRNVRLKQKEKFSTSWLLMSANTEIYKMAQNVIPLKTLKEIFEELTPKLLITISTLSLNMSEKLKKNTIPKTFDWIKV